MKGIVTQVILIVIGLIIAFIIYSLTRSFIREKRISSFALSNDDLSELSFVEKINRLYWRFVRFLSNNLGSNKIIESLSLDYDKYILTSEKNYKSGVDYMAIKILSTILFIIILVLLIVLETLPNNIFLLLLFMLLGFYFPDIFWIFNYNNKCNLIANKLYQSIIIISDNIGNMAIEDAMSEVIRKLDGPIKDEYKKMLVDLSYNISLKDAYLRFYKRTKIKDILYICNILDINENNLLASFTLIRDKFESLIKKNNITSNNNKLLFVLSCVYLLIPILFVVSIAIIIPNYFDILRFYSHSYIIIIFLVFIYLLLLYVLKVIAGDKR